jgi:hypothetical protein
MIPFIIAGAIGYGIAKLLEKDDTKKFVKGGGVDSEIESMKSMMKSLYTYGGIERGSYGFNKYLSISSKSFSSIGPHDKKSSKDWCSLISMFS